MCSDAFVPSYLTSQRTRPVDDADAEVPGSARDPRLDLSDHRPDLHGRVEGPRDTPDHIVGMAMRVECPDCQVNVFIEKDASSSTGYKFVVAHDECCPWLTEQEAHDND